MMRQPSAALVVSGVTFTLSEDLSVVVAGNDAAATPARRRLDILGAREEIGAWLAEHALWLDREQEPAIEALERSARNTAAAYLRRVARIEGEPFELDGPWLRRATMPRLPGRGASRTAIAGHQAGHMRWIERKQARWARLRAAAAQALETGRRLAQAREKLRLYLDGPAKEDDQVPKLVFGEFVAALHRGMSLGAARRPEPGRIEFDLLLPETESVSDVRHVVLDDRTGLQRTVSAAVRGERLAHLAIVAALALVDLLALLRSERRTVSFRAASADGASGRLLPVLARTFETGEILVHRKTLVAAIAQRRPAILPG